MLSGRIAPHTEETAYVPGSNKESDWCTPRAQEYIAKKIEYAKELGLVPTTQVRIIATKIRGLIEKFNISASMAFQSFDKEPTILCVEVHETRGAASWISRKNLGINEVVIDDSGETADV